jgi:hypothetical protein
VQGNRTASVPEKMTLDPLSADAREWFVMSIHSWMTAVKAAKLGTRMLLCPVCRLTAPFDYEKSKQAAAAAPVHALPYLAGQCFPINSRIDWH